MKWNESIPIITLWQPWASWVMLGWKTIETRTHRRFAGLAGKTIGIHASVKWDEFAIEAARPYMCEQQISHSRNFLRIGGAILGTVECIEFRKLIPRDAPAAMIECNTPRWGNFIGGRVLIDAIPCKGKQGVWYYKSGDR